MKTEEKLILLLKKYEDTHRQLEKIRKDLLPVIRRIKDSEIPKLIEKYPQLKQWLT